jgi:hypothetical protein
LGSKDKKYKKKKKKELGKVALAYNPSTWEVEAGRSQAQECLPSKCEPLSSSSSTTKKKKKKKKQAFKS